MQMFIDIFNECFHVNHFYKYSMKTHVIISELLKYWYSSPGTFACTWLWPVLSETPLNYFDCIFFNILFKICAYTNFIVLFHSSIVNKNIEPIDDNKVISQYNSEYMHDYAS